ncbi:ABC transporter ATP-binding protein [Peptoanaerobacter stomatis]|uniref:ABC transporter ATP-binding protein n=1 Tax=Peptoanaerobacter stomatis TaxID=796937 RepID=UPI003F9F2128
MKENYSVFYLFKRFKPYYKKYYGTLLIDLICAMFSTMCDLILPIILRFLTNTARQDINKLTINLILMLGGLFAVLRILDTMANYYMQYIGHVMGAKIETDMRYDVFSKLQQLPYSYYNTNKSGQILSRITTDLFEVTEFAHHCPEEFLIGGVKLIISFLILININVPLTLAIFATLPVMVISISRYNSSMRNSQKSQRNQIGELNSGIENNILGAKVVKSFANEELEIEKFHKENLKFLGIKKIFYKSLTGFHAVSRIFDGIMYLIVIVYGSYLMKIGEITAGDMFLYTLYINMLLATVKRIVEFMEQFQRGMTGIERFIEIMDVENDIKDSENAIELTDVKGDIKFDNVSFSYPLSEVNVLDNVSFSIKRGENVALVGSSGVGKTTISNLIPRFYDINSGSITLDGINIKDIKQISLRNNIGIVQQDVYLFSGTVYENIIYGKKDATKDDVIKAAKMAGAYDFIMDLENGFDTHIGERGTKLSGGQKQRISIARVFLKNPPILILDEATSALDNTSEAIVQKSLEILADGRTTFTIAHRLSTIKNATKILVLTENGIEESGTHNELMNKKGVYYNLYNKNIDETAVNL